MGYDCLCQACDAERFREWRNRVRRLGGDLEMAEGSPRMNLIHELHASVCARYPIGIAETLYGIITDLHIGEDRNAIADLEDMIATEEASMRLNPGEEECQCEEHRRR